MISYFEENSIVIDVKRMSKVDYFLSDCIYGQWSGNDVSFLKNQNKLNKGISVSILRKNWTKAVYFNEIWFSQ